MSRVVTRSGILLDLTEPDPNSILRADVLAGLSGSCRFAGQTDVFYSVAQHSVMVADLVNAFLDREEALFGRQRGALLIGALHHDSHEAFMSDLPAPLKELLPEYERIAARLDVAIHGAIGIASSVREDGSWDLIQRADMAARCVEALTVMPGAAKVVLESTAGVTEEDLELAHDLWLAPEHPAGARNLFIAREEAYYRLLTREVEQAGEGVTGAETSHPHILRYPLDWFSQIV